MAFVMRDEWKEEPVSTTGAQYVEPSATELIKPGRHRGKHGTSGRQLLQIR